MLCHIQIKNYRCFNDTTPAEFDISDGFTAFLGPNNSGKSSILRMFFEFRTLWQHLSHVGGVQSILRQGVNLDAQRVSDAAEIFNDRNERPLSIEFMLDEAGKARNVITRVRVTCDRRPGNRWTAEIVAKDGAAFGTASSMMIQDNYLASNGKLYDYTELSEVFRLVADSQYIGPFRNAINEGAASHYDLSVGTSFIDTWDSWKSGDNKANMLAIQKITEDIRNIFRFDQLDINANRDGKKLNLYVNGKPYKNYEVGAGLSQFIIVLGNVAIRRPALVFIDEPELNLHPALQMDFLTSLASYAHNGVIFATHSVGLARSVAERIYSTQVEEMRHIVRPYESIPNLSEYLGEMSFSSYAEMGYKKILLVEGVTEIKTFQQFLRKLRRDHEIVLISLGGDSMARGNVEHELREIKRVSESIFCVVDSERPAANQPAAKRRIEFEECCKRAGIDVHLTELRATENYLGDRAIKAVFGEQYKQLGPYERLAESKSPWSKSRNWEVAREMTLEEMKATDVGRYLEGIFAGP